MQWNIATSMALNEGNILTIFFALMGGCMLLSAVYVLVKTVRGAGARAKQAPSLNRKDAEWDIRDGVLDQYKGEQSDVHVPEGVTRVRMSAFKECRVRSVVMPSTLREMSAWAFNDCANLREVTFADTFCWNESDHYFNECDKLSAITYRGQRCTDFVVENDVLLLCLLRKERIETPSGVRRIGGRLFQYGCGYDYAQIRVSEGVTEIGENALRGAAVRKIVLPSTLQTLAESAFAYCHGLMWVELAGAGEYENMLILGDVLIAALCNDGVYVVPNGVRRIGNDAFSSARIRAVRSIELPDTLESIGTGAFAFLPVSRLRVPDRVREIEWGAFMYWNEHQTLELPSRFRESANDRSGWRKECKAKIVYY